MRVRTVVTVVTNTFRCLNTRVRGNKHIIWASVPWSQTSWLMYHSSYNHLSLRLTQSGQTKETDSFPSFIRLPLTSRSTRAPQCWVSLWRASCWGRPPLSCSRFSHHSTALWRLFMTRAKGGGYWRSPRTCLSRGGPNAPADASRRTCVSPLLTPTQACSPQVCLPETV